MLGKFLPSWQAPPGQLRHQDCSPNLVSSSIFFNMSLQNSLVANKLLDFRLRMLWFMPSLKSKLPSTRLYVIWYRPQVTTIELFFIWWQHCRVHARKSECHHLRQCGVLCLTPLSQVTSHNSIQRAFGRLNRSVLIHDKIPLQHIPNTI